MGSCFKMIDESGKSVEESVNGRNDVIDMTEMYIVQSEIKYLKLIHWSIGYLKNAGKW